MGKITTTARDLLVIAGDPSGDLHASNLVREIKKKNPSVIVSSIGGVRLKEVSNKFIYDLVSHGSFGFLDSIKSFNLWFKMISIVRKFLESKKPFAVIVVDFYGFNRQVLGLCRNRNIPVYYYIPPQVWASRPKRAVTISKIAKKIFAIFPFEVDIYKKLGADVYFVGHPLLDIIPEVNIKDKLAVDRNENYEWKIGVLPGSRKSEIERHLKVFMDVFYRLKENFKVKGYLFAVPEFSDEYLFSVLSSINIKWEDDIEIVRDENYRIRKEMDFCLTCSGTATLENALLGIPMIVGYKTSYINYEIARAIIKVPYVSLVNIILNREVVKEFIQYDFKSEKICDEVVSVLCDSEKYSKLSEDVFSVKKLLGAKGVADKISQIILEDFNFI